MQEALQKPAADRQIGIWRRAAAVNACTVRWESIDHWVVARFRSCVKTLPPRGRCPSAHTGADEEWRYLSFSNAVRKNGCNRKIIAILTGCSQRCNLSPFLIRLAFGDPPMNYGVIATGNDYYFDSLRGAPPPGEGFGRRKRQLTSPHITAPLHSLFSSKKYLQIILIYLLTNIDPRGILTM